jgi:hypothetical protein
MICSMCFLKLCTKGAINILFHSYIYSKRSISRTPCDAVQGQAEASMNQKIGMNTEPRSLPSGSKLLRGRYRLRPPIRQYVLGSSHADTRRAARLLGFFCFPLEVLVSCRHVR